MYEKHSANNKVFLMKKLLFEDGLRASVAAHLNEFNIIDNQLSSAEINFDDEVCVFLLLASLPNSWEPMRAAVSNYVGSEKLKNLMMSEIEFLQKRFTEMILVKLRHQVLL